MSKDNLVRFSVSVNWDLLDKFDEMIKKEGYENRSFAIRYLLQEFVLSKEMRTYRKKGSFLIVVVSEGSVECGGDVSMSLSLDGKRILTVCFVKGGYEKAVETVKKLRSLSCVRLCNMMPVSVDND